MLWRMVLLLAVLFMPFGMTPAAATSHSPQAVMPMSHCPEQVPDHGGKAGFVECTMACSAALPAGDIGQGEPVRIARAPDRPAAARQLHGLHPDTATPPPKRS